MTAWQQGNQIDCISLWASGRQLELVRRNKNEVRHMEHINNMQWGKTPCRVPRRHPLRKTWHPGDAHATADELCFSGKVKWKKKIEEDYEGKKINISEYQKQTGNSDCFWKDTAAGKAGFGMKSAAADHSLWEDKKKCLEFAHLLSPFTIFSSLLFFPCCISGKCQIFFCITRLLGREARVSSHAHDLSQWL